MRPLEREAEAYTYIDGTSIYANDMSRHGRMGI